MKIALPLILLLLVAALVATAQPAIVAGPGSSPTAIVLVERIRALTAENEMLRARVTTLEAALNQSLQIRQRDIGLRTPPTNPLHP